MVNELASFGRKVRLPGLVTAALLAIGLLIVLFPIMWMVFASMRPVSETFGTPPAWIPREISFEAYESIFFDPRQQRHQVNTYVIALSTAFLSVGLGSLAAYGFSRFKIRGARFILLGILALQMVPGVSIIIPFYNMARWAGIWDTYLAMILADTAFALAISIWLLKGYVDSIPIDLEEAAMVDGCSRFQAFYKIVLPLLAPGLVGIATFAFLYGWNDFVFATILRDGHELMPMTVAIGNFFTSHSRDWNSIMALNTMATLPLIALFILLQRWVIKGMTAGAVK
ncbi:MAG: carbohydrate ABC transporter permease [Anaerolineae bacterium]|nr:MAG: carbohydrate ABC transporter permease [Anaerolineae bacterium]